MREPKEHYVQAQCVSDDELETELGKWLAEQLEQFSYVVALAKAYKLGYEDGGQGECEEGYDKGYEDGYEEGYEDGEFDGHNQWL